MEKLFFKIHEFEGPMDLILHLLSRHQLNICDIEIAALLDQYMAWLRSMEEQNLEVSSEFLEMASRLVYIKTVSLLPQAAQEAEAEKAQLVGQLLEYQACKAAAAMLSLRSEGFSIFVRGAEPIEYNRTYTRRHPPALLAQGYWNAIGKGRRRLPPPTEVFSPLVAAPVVSVNSQVLHILRALYRQPVLSLDKLFLASRSRSELVARFMAVLELMRGGRVGLSEDGGQIHFIPGRRQPRRSGISPQKGSE